MDENQSLRDSAEKSGQVENARAIIDQLEVEKSGLMRDKSALSTEVDHLRSRVTRLEADNAAMYELNQKV